MYHMLVYLVYGFNMVFFHARFGIGLATGNRRYAGGYRIHHEVIIWQHDVFLGMYTIYISIPCRHSVIYFLTTRGREDKSFFYACDAHAAKIRWSSNEEEIESLKDFLSC